MTAWPMNVATRPAVGLELFPDLRERRERPPDEIRVLGLAERRRTAHVLPPG